MPDITYEIKYQTARSGGKGGQNVNKVETMVEGYWHINKSSLVTEEEKEILAIKLANRINAAGFFMMKSQAGRSQLENKSDVTAKMVDAVIKALILPKKRRPTKVPAAVKRKRLEGKKVTGEKKLLRKKVES